MLYKAMSKIYLAGEYAILKPKGIAVIAPVAKYTYLEITKNESEIIESNIEDKNNLISNSMKVAFEYAGKYEKFRYKYTTELYKNNVKLGLGSSASIVVLTIKAILLELNIKYSLDTLFKLSVKAMHNSNMYGSMGDIACIVYEKLIEYHSIDDKLNYFVREIELKNILDIYLIHTNQYASTSKQIRNIDIQDNEFKKFYNLSNKYTLDFINSLKTGDTKLLEKSIENLNKNLKYLETIQNVKIYTKEIDNILKKYKNSKTSGAGLGDYVVSLDIKKELGNKYILHF